MVPPWEVLDIPNPLMGSVSWAARALFSQHFLSGFFEWNTSGQRLFLTTCEMESAAATSATPQSDTLDLGTMTKAVCLLV